MKENRTTLEDLKQMTCATLTPAVVADVYGVDAQWLRAVPLVHPEWIPFPFIRTGAKGDRIRFPRIPFIRFMEGRAGEQTNEEEDE